MAEHLRDRPHRHRPTGEHGRGRGVPEQVEACPYVDAGSSESWQSLWAAPQQNRRNQPVARRGAIDYVVMLRDHRLIQRVGRSLPMSVRL
jgi:hypothetical protein